jgi:hypothetical protein
MCQQAFFSHIRAFELVLAYWKGGSLLFIFIADVLYHTGKIRLKSVWPRHGHGRTCFPLVRVRFILHTACTVNPKGTQVLIGPLYNIYLYYGLWCRWAVVRTRC